MLKNLINSNILKNIKDNGVLKEIKKISINSKNRKNKGKSLKEYGFDLVLFNYNINRKKLKSEFILQALGGNWIFYKGPKNLTYFWSFGSLAVFCLAIQVITGVILAMHYVPTVDRAFASVYYIMTEVNLGWFFRYIHLNVASLFFAVIYIHMGRGLYYGSFFYPKQAVWVSGVLLFLIMIITAFLGYVLPWGQMSFWAATVITGLITAIPKVGILIAEWLWGGYSVSEATLNRFYSLHFFLPFMLVFLSKLHITLLHEHGSNNPILLQNINNNINLYPGFIVKDLFMIVLLIVILLSIIWISPEILNHPDNYIESNPLQTPAHIVPEWYFLPFYAVLRSVETKEVGILLLVGVIVALLFLPWLWHRATIVRSSKFRIILKVIVPFMFVDYFLLGFLGNSPVIYPYTLLSQIITIHLLLCIFLPIVLIQLEEFIIINSNKKIEKKKLNLSKGYSNIQWIILS